MNYTSISIHGNILSSEIFEKIRLEDARFQNAKDFGLNPSASVRDEINNSWSLAITNWQIFKQKREALGPIDTGTSETRKNWMLPLLHILGFEAGTAAAELINNKSYAVSHRASNKDGFPIHIVGVNQSLDKRADSGGARLSPHALIQEYINNTEHLYGITTNGVMLRILRDATRLSRLSYVEFNLEQMMEEGLFAEFALLYRTLHASRFANRKEDNGDSVFEFYHQDALSSGSRIREKLSSAVEHSILLLANGLLEHPSNQKLRTQMAENKISAQQYYLFVLRTVYRILFLLVIEERKLIYPQKLDADYQRKREIYFRYYSIQRLSKLIEKNIYIDSKKTDLWQSLVTTFRLFEYKDMGSQLGISALGSGIFQPYALGGMEEQLLSNETLLKVLKYLLTFQNESGQLVRVNYADLDVEEFGSIYEGLLEYAPEVKNDHFNFVKGTERSSSGSHYTPEELVKPLITNSLDYLIADKMKEADPETGLLSLTICDVACGSGHILLSAARRVGFELAKLRSGEDQPTPSVLRIAIRDVIKNCIYGVDLNPLAVELCKVALWLEAHEPGQPLNFLDHHIKCGNAIVGLASYDEIRNGISSEAFKTLPGDDKEIAAALRKKNDAELKSQVSELFAIDAAEHNLEEIQKAFAEFSQLKEDTSDQIAAKERAYEKLITGKKWFRLKQLADIQVAQFFISKTLENKDRLTTYSKYKNYVTTGQQILDQGASMSVAAEKRFFHWFLEFPHIFMNGGFDCILGNPPFLGGADISKKYNLNLTNFLYTKYSPARNRADFVTYFVRRISEISKHSFSLITTNSISEGDTRSGGLDFILNKNEFTINHAVKSKEWPGQAKLYISIISLSKLSLALPKILDGKKVSNVSSFLDSNINEDPPYTLAGNKNQVYLGCKLLGDGFIISEIEYRKLLDKNKLNHHVIKKIFNGEYLGSMLDKKSKDYAIYFQDWDLNKCKKYDEALQIVKELVKPERDLQKDKLTRENWWLYARPRIEMYKHLQKTEFCYVWPRTSKYISITKIDSDSIFTDGVCVYVGTDEIFFPLIQSTIHYEWARKYSSKLKNDLRYSNTDAYETFPRKFENDTVKLIELGNLYLSIRCELITKFQLGITKLYNLFNSASLVKTSEVKDKQVEFLSKHLAKIKSNVSIVETVEDIIKLRQLHKEMDEAVLKAYDWSDISLRHDFYEVDYLPENDRVRYTIHPDARKEILKRLLELNHKIHAEEVAAGLWEKNKSAKTESAVKNKTIKAVGRDSDYQSLELFEEPNLFNQEPTVSEECSVIVKNADGKIFKYHITPKAEKGSFTGEYKQIKPESSFASALVGKKISDDLVFAEIHYTIIEIQGLSL